MRDVMVYSESFKTWAPCVEYAARLAASFDAHVTGVWICPSPNAAMPSIEAPDLIEELFEATRALEDEAFGAGPSFVDFARKQGARNASWQVAEGYVPDALDLAGRWHDLLVIGRTSNTVWGSLSAVGNVVLGANLACLVVPAVETRTATFDNIAIAWNGSAEALHAVHSALPLLARAKRIVILHGEQRPPAGMMAWRPAFDLASYLLRHGMHAESQLLGGSDQEIGATLLSAAHNADANLLVMGGYGHSRFSEWILGGATRYVLDKATLPVLLRH